MGVFKNPAEKGHKPRPIKILMPSSQHQRHCLSAWKRERIKICKDELSNIFLRPSLTLQQRQFEYEQRVARRKEREKANMDGIEVINTHNKNF
ncbi:unnamed protein product [Meloidogyne enterolobii]